MNDLKFDFRQLLKNPGFTVHPPRFRRPYRVQFPRCCSRKPGHLRQYCYGGRAMAVLTLARRSRLLSPKNAPHLPVINTHFDDVVKRNASTNSTLQLI